MSNQEQLKFHAIFILILVFCILSSIVVLAEEKNKGDSDKPIPQSLRKIISLDLHNVSLEEALIRLTKKGKFKLNYNRDRIPVKKNISLEVSHVTAYEALNRMLKGTGTELLVTAGGQLAVVPTNIAVEREPEPTTGIIQGRICDSSGAPMSTVSVDLKNQEKTELTDSQGFFCLEDVLPGEHTAVFSCYGFETLELPDIAVKRGQVTEVQVKMVVLPFEVKTESVDVYGSFKSSKNPLSAFSLSANDFQGSPESSGGVSRMIYTFPGISFISDENLDYVIRGGSPLENSFYVDDIELPSIHHIHMLGSQGGFYSSLNPNLVQNIDFLSGCFSSDYGDRLSSVTRITLREGNRDRFAGTADISLAGAEAHFEGPMANKQGAWIISLRRSHLYVLQGLGVDLETVPQTLDSQMKFTFDISPRHRVNILNFYGGGSFRQKEPDVDVVMNMQQVQNTTGINWTSNWNQDFFSSTSLSYSFHKRGDGELFNTGYIDPPLWKYGESAQTFNLKNTNFLILSNAHKLDFGFQIKHESAEFEYLIDQPFVDYFGRVLQAVDLDMAYRATKFSLYSSYVARFWDRLILSAGLRGDYSSLHDKVAFSPRLSLTYRISSSLTLNGGMGIFYQTIPMNYLASIPGASSLKDMQANHYVLGLEYISESGIRFTLEAYAKEYDHLPISLDIPYNLLTDLSLDYSADEYFPSQILPTRIVDKGTASSRGIELLFQKRWHSNFSTILSISYFKSRYTDLYGVTRNRVFDSQYIINFVLKYRPFNKWEVSGRWISMGGAPYTPMDINKTAAAKTLILDQSQFLAYRYPGYNRANLRVSRLLFAQNKTIYIYAEIWNFLHQDLDNQLGVVPLLGIKYQF